MAARIQRLSIVAALSASILALYVHAADPPLTPDMQAVMEHISADSLRGNLSFLASDLLEGRNTPSRGLDLAAEYIAAQFRRAGLEPAGDDGYFQTASLILREPEREGFEMTVTSKGRTLNIAAAEAYLAPPALLRLDNAGLLIADGSQRLTAGAVDGKVVLIPGERPAPAGAKPALILRLVTSLPSTPQVVNPEEPQGGRSAWIAKPDLLDFLGGSTDAVVTIRSAAARERSVKVRNVAGLLRGSDPRLSGTYVMLTAHYDHVGVAQSGEDRIFNGANDDGSGTVSVIEIAGALAALPKHPQRSILFVTFFGEERGLWGSRYYGRHPLVPPAKTIADLNLEQVGRTDATNGPQIKTASITGFDFSDLPPAMAQSARLAGVKVYKDGQASDAYFARSDNQALADLGIPAHTLFVALDFPDYHKVGDHWDKIDYSNMAAVDRGVALGLLHLASDAPPPQWNESYTPARRYTDAAKKLRL